MSIKQAKAQALLELMEAQRNADTEAAHSLADNTLCIFLIELGYEDIVREYRKVDKWFA